MARSAAQQLEVVDLEGNAEDLVLGRRDVSAVGWSPDGGSIVYASLGQIYTYDVVLGTQPRQLTFDGNNADPVFSPDGSQVAFASRRPGTAGFDLFVKDVDNDTPPRSILRLDDEQFASQWPIDSLIVFETGSLGQTPNGLWTLDLSDLDSPEASEYLSSEAGLHSMVVSPDGRLAAYVSDESGRMEVYIRSFPDPGGPTRVSSDGGDVPFWSPDGSTLYYATALSGAWRAARLQRDPVPVVLTIEELFVREGSVRTFRGARLHPAGDRFIFTRALPTASEREGGRGDRLILIVNFFEELKRLVPN
jgi:Tol biopolymer transport system component